MNNKTNDLTLNMRCSNNLLVMARRMSRDVYPLSKGESGPKESAARFFKMAALEKMASLGVYPDEYIKGVI